MTIPGLLIASVLPAICAISFGIDDAVARTETIVASPSGSDGASSSPIVSADGRYVVFLSDASNLVTNVVVMLRLPFVNVYRRDLATGAIQLVSITPDGSSGGDGNSFAAAVSTNGQFVLFQSDASNLVANDTNQTADIFVRDMASGDTVLVSTRHDGSGPGNDASSSPVMTPDGRFVAFVSAASDLVADDTNGIPDVFLCDLKTGTTALVSIGAVKTSDRVAASGFPALSDDGRIVAFASNAEGLVVGPPVGPYSRHVYVRDVTAGATSRISQQRTTAWRDLTGSPALSANGRFVAYQIALDLLNPSLNWHDRQSNLTVLAVSSLEYEPEPAPPLMTADGSRLCYERLESQNGPNQVYVWDAASKTSTLVSVGLNGTQFFRGASRNSAMNRTGTHVAFTSTAANLVANATNGAAQVYVRDLTTGTTLLVSNTTEGNAGEADPQSPALNEDGLVIAFVGGSDGAYVAGDTNGFPDVFVRNRATGITQIVSAVAPAPPGLILTIAMATDGQVRVTWPVDAGKNYRVQYALNLRDSWSDLAANPTMANGIASILIAPGPTSQSFYRVMATP